MTQHIAFLCSKQMPQHCDESLYLKHNTAFMCDGTPSSPPLATTSGPFREYSCFAETIVGDWFDHDCRPKLQCN